MKLDFTSHRPGCCGKFRAWWSWRVFTEIFVALCFVAYAGYTEFVTIPAIHDDIAEIRALAATAGSNVAVISDSPTTAESKTMQKHHNSRDVGVSEISPIDGLDYGVANATLTDPNDANLTGIAEITKINRKYTYTVAPTGFLNRSVVNINMEALFYLDITYGSFFNDGSTTGQSIDFTFVLPEDIKNAVSTSLLPTATTHSSDVSDFPGQIIPRAIEGINVVNGPSITFKLDTNDLGQTILRASRFYLPKFTDDGKIVQFTLTGSFEIHG